LVPKGRARIRTQMSAAHSCDDLEFALEAFARVKKQLAI
jgi:glycine C-acetyltransferase